MRIVIEGNDGTGKSTLAELLRLAGVDAIDRGEMTEATIDPDVQPRPGTVYLLLHCDWRVCRSRLEAAGKDMHEEWHTDESLQKYEKKFLELAPRFGAKVIDANAAIPDVFCAAVGHLGLDGLRQPERLNEMGY